MIVKKTNSGQYLMFPEYKPLYILCRTCARLVPDGICKRCREEIHTTTPWYRINQLPIRKAKKSSVSRKAIAILEAYKLR